MTTHTNENDYRLTNAEKETARQWLYAHNGDEGGGLGGLWQMVEGIVRARDQHHLDMHRAYRPEAVAEVAVHLGSHEDWDEMARWCGGRIESSQDPSGEYTSTLILPNGEAGGDWAWLVLNHAGEFHIRAEVAAPEVVTPPEGPPVEMRHCEGCGEDFNVFEESHVGHVPFPPAGGEG